MEYEVEVEILATVRVEAQDEDCAMDEAVMLGEIGILDRVHTVRPLIATEA